jgi:hypothetical protein
MQLRLVVDKDHREQLADTCYTIEDWTEWLDFWGIEWFDDKYEAKPFLVKKMEDRVTYHRLKITWALSRTVDADGDVSSINAPLRDLLMNVKPKYISKGMFEQYNNYLETGEWENGEVEHATPALETATKVPAAKTPTHMINIINKHHMVVYVTQTEKHQIPKELNSRLPEGGTWHDRYDISNIEVHPELFSIPNKLVPSGARIG